MAYSSQQEPLLDIAQDRIRKRTLTPIITLSIGEKFHTRLKIEPGIVELVCNDLSPKPSSQTIKKFLLLIGVENQNSIHEEIKRKAGNTCYYSVKILLSS